MKSAVLKKTSQVLAVLMIVSMLLPVLAFAGTLSFGDVKYDQYKKTITGTVYSNVYNVSDSVYFTVYSDANASNVVSSVYTATYDQAKSVTGTTYFNFTVNLMSTVANSVYFKAWYGSVNSSVYKADNTGIKPDDDGGPRGGGGGVAGNTVNADGSIQASSDGSVTATALTDAFAKSSTPTVAVKDVALLPASALVEAAKKSGTSLTIKGESGTYALPLSVLKLDEIAKSMGVAVADLTLKVEIKKVAGNTATGVNGAVSAAGATSVADSVDFAVTVVGKDGKTANINFGSTYVSRTLNATKALDSKKATGVLYNPATGKFSFVPTAFTSVDGKSVATLKRNGNSIYTVVEVNKSFADLASHWSKADVELLANKLVVEGVAEGKFDADRNITRAEFAALVVRSLGLTEVAANSSFKDVSASAWYAATVATAANAGIINGYEDSTFRPEATITREELSAMVIRALSYAGVASEPSADRQAELLKKFKDAAKIVWAHKEVAAAINAGIINGLTDDTIGSSSQATRAQAATMLKRFLTTAQFIN